MTTQMGDGEYMLKGALPDYAHVPLTIWLKDGKICNPGEPGAVRHVIGEAVVRNGILSNSLYDRVPDEVMDVLIKYPSDVSFSLGFAQGEAKINIPVPRQEALFDPIYKEKFDGR